MANISFEEMMFTLMSAAHDTLSMYLGTEVFAGKVERGMNPINSDIVGMVGVGGDRVSYILFAAAAPTARIVAKAMLSIDEPTDESMCDAIGELTNNIAGLFKNKFQEQYGNVALGLPLVVSGLVRPPAGEVATKAGDPGVKMQFKGVTIPFKSMDGSVSFRVMILV